MLGVIRATEILALITALRLDFGHAVSMFKKTDIEASSWTNSGSKKGR